MAVGNENEIAKLEHNETFHAKKVIPYTILNNGTAGSLTADGFNIGDYDYVSLAQASTTDTYTFKTGGSSGTTVATITITYTDSGKGTLSTVVKT